MTLSELARKVRPLIEKAAESLGDMDALEAPLLFKRWTPGETVAPGDRRYYPLADKLYKVNKGQGHTTQADWTPDKTPALWSVVSKGQTGAVDDPIDAARGMEYQYGLYYLDPEDGKRYLCCRGTETGTISLQYLPHELVGHYFEEVTA